MNGFEALQAAQVRRATAQQKGGAMRALAEGAVRTFAAAAVSAALSLGAWQAWRWATTAGTFALEEVRVTGLAHAGQAELLQRSGLNLGDNLFRIDLARAARAMETHPWVSSVRLDRRFPRTLLATVTEHRAAALVQLGGLYLLDEQGKLFKRATAEDGLDLPLITGLSRERFQEQQLRLFGALHLLDTWQASGFSVAAISEVRLDEDGGTTLFAHDGDAVQQVRVGASDVSLKLKRLQQIRAALARRGERAARIDLDNPARPDQAAATLADKR
jgi:cell division protein FtsQ